MAYDPQARKQSNSAMIIGLVTLVVVGLAALAYFATRPTTPPETGSVIIDRKTETVVATPTPGAPNNTTVIVVPTAAPDPNIVNNAVVVAPPVNNNNMAPQAAPPRNAAPAPRAPVASPPADNSDKGKTTINNTIINPPAPSGRADKAKPIAPDSTNADNAATANAAPADSNAVEGY